jgi:endonuclease/exonuclease/phosphatase family metal-dependent hydrolase
MLKAIPQLLLLTSTAVACSGGVTQDAPSATGAGPSLSEEEPLEATVRSSEQADDEFDTHTSDGAPELGIEDAAELGTEGEAAIGQTSQALSTNGLRVLTLNVRYDSTTSTIESWSKRRPRIKNLIRHRNPDIIALQEVEEDTWDDISSDFDDYHRWYQPRGGFTNPDEGVALLVRASRFDSPSEWDEKTLSPEEQQARCVTTDWINRNIIRFKVRDKKTNRTLDLFSTHFPAKKDCYKKAMAKKVANWVEDYGDNILLMGDFNTGWDASGDMEEPFDYLYDMSSVDLDDAIRTDYGRSFRASDSIITDKADTPWKRFGRMIDHIMIGPAFILEDAKIDRSLFSGTTRVWCDGTSMRTNDDGTRDECKVGSSWVDVEDLDTYSDHWAVWADLRRIDCPDGC